MEKMKKWIFEAEFIPYQAIVCKAVKIAWCNDPADARGP
jgi:hypothetical protein